MRAVVCVPGGTEVAEVPDPVPARDGVVVEVAACGLCGSDVHAIERGQTAEGQVLGHEFSGRVVEVGAGVTGWRVGGSRWRSTRWAPVAGAATAAAACRSAAPSPTSASPRRAGTPSTPRFPRRSCWRSPRTSPSSSAPTPSRWRSRCTRWSWPTWPRRRRPGLRCRHDRAQLRHGAQGRRGRSSVPGALPGRRAAARAAGADVVLDTRETSVARACADTGQPVRRGARVLRRPAPSPSRWRSWAREAPAWWWRCRRRARWCRCCPGRRRAAPRRQLRLQPVPVRGLPSRRS